MASKTDPSDSSESVNPHGPDRILPYSPTADDLVISRQEYLNRLYGFWLGRCIANWTGLVTEMDEDRW